MYFLITYSNGYKFTQWGKSKNELEQWLKKAEVQFISVQPLQ